MITRRQILKGLMLTGGYCLLPLGGRGWALAAPEVAQRRLIVLLMRGAVDGLSIVTPYTERNYYALRPSIALAPPGQSDGLLDLDGFFGLHPSLAPLMPLWQSQSLAFIHASGSPAETRSHFEAQDIMETALLNSALAQQGWMNGLAQFLPNNHSATRVLSFGDVLPKIFQGRLDVSTVPNGLRGNRGGKIANNPQMQDEFAKLYGTQTELGGLYLQGVSARTSMMADLQDEMDKAGNGAPSPDAFTAQTTKLASMIRRDPSIQLAFMDVGGWDTHVGQGNAKGQLANRLEKLGDGLSALAQGLGTEYTNTAILVMSEFGRTVAENGNKGTDHGHGNVAWLMGGTVKGGKVYGRWPGLSSHQLWEGRDLAVTTDFRSIIAATIAGHFGLDGSALQQIIPNCPYDPSLNDMIG